jgi:hypothetical protein
LVPAAAEARCTDCGGPLPEGRRYGRCGRCQAAHARSGLRQGGGTNTRAERSVAPPDSVQAEIRALARCADALGALPEAARARALRYLWALYSGQSAGKES